jgi:hypothetical protein
MERATQKDEISEQTSTPQEVVASQVQEALAEIMASGPFRSSKQSRDLLRYIVDQSLSGHAEALKERLIGVEVFGRRPDYDTNNDPVVRARAAELRKRLALYYQSERAKSVRITVPHGSFKACFERTDGNPAGPQTPLLHPADVPQISVGPIAVPHISSELAAPPVYRKFRNHIALSAIAVLAVALVFAAQHYLASTQSQAFNRFWSPILDNPHTTLIYVGGNAVYELSPAYLDEYYKQHPRTQPEEMGFETYIQWPPGTRIDAEDLYPAKDTFVTIGDVAAITKIEALLVRRSKPFDIRYGSDVTFGDLRESPTVLIGAHNNMWTLTMTENLRYVFSGNYAIIDRSDLKKRWSSTASFSEDYAIVSRVLNSKTGTIVIAVAGIGYAGTQAAAEFLTNSQSMSTLAKSLPNGWEKKNLQFVLHTTVTNQLPSAPDIVAIYSW